MVTKKLKPVAMATLLALAFSQSYAVTSSSSKQEIIQGPWHIDANDTADGKIEVTSDLINETIDWVNKRVEEGGEDPTKLRLYFTIAGNYFVAVSGEENPAPITGSGTVILNDSDGALPEIESPNRHVFAGVYLWDTASHLPQGRDLVSRNATLMIESGVYNGAEAYASFLDSWGNIESNSSLLTLSGDKANVESMSSMFSAYIRHSSDSDTTLKLLNNRMEIDNYHLGLPENMGVAYLYLRSSSVENTILMNNNALSITNSDIQNDVLIAAATTERLGYSDDDGAIVGEANGNTVDIVDTTGSVYALAARLTHWISSCDFDFDFVNNIVRVDHSDITGALAVTWGGDGLSAQGSTIDATVVNNLVDIRNGSEIISAGIASIDATGKSGNVYFGNNRLVIDGSTIDDYRGGNSGISYPGSVNGTSVTTYSLYADGTEVTSDVKVTFENNSISIRDSYIHGSVNLISVNGPADGVTLSGNYIEILDGVEVEGFINGAEIDPNPSSFDDENFYLDGDTTIRIRGNNNSAWALQGFKTLELVAGEGNYSESIDGSKAVFTITGPYETNFNDREIVVSLADGYQLPETGVLNLIHVEYWTGSLVLPSDSVIRVDDTFRSMKWEVLGEDLTFTEGETLALGLSKGEESQPDNGISPPTETPTDNALTLAGSHLGSAAMIGLGTEYIADEGLAMIEDSARLPGRNTFAAVYGGYGKYRGETHTNLDSTTLIAGVSALADGGKAAFSAFFEIGQGQAKDYINGAKTQADHEVYSLGAAARFFTESPLYFDASLRLGAASYDFTGSFATETVKFDHHGAYAALHAAAGWAEQVSEGMTWDSYLRYSFTYLASGSETLGNRSNDTFEMDSLGVSTFRVGTRLKGWWGDDRSIHARAGLAYERVVDADVKTSVSGLAIDGPSLKGDTGILELGLSRRPSTQSPWGADVTVKSYVGDRRGVYGSATMHYVF